MAENTSYKHKAEKAENVTEIMGNKTPSVSGLYFNKFSLFIFTALIFLIPVLFLPSAFFNLQMTKIFFTSAIISIIFILWELSIFKAGRIQIPKSFLLCAIIFLPIVLLISAIFSTGPISAAIIGRGFETGTFAFLSLSALLAAVSAILVRTRSDAVRVYIAIFASLAAVMAFQLVRIFFGFDVLSFGGVFSTSTANLIGRWNDLGIFMGFGAFLSLSSIEFIPLGMLPRTLAHIFLLGFLFVLAVVNFIPAWTALAVFSLLLALYHISFFQNVSATAKNINLAEGSHSVRKRSADIFSRLPTTALATFLISAFFVFASGPLGNFGNFLSEKFNISHLEARPSWAATISIAEEALKESPVLGLGPNHFVQQWLKSKPEGINETIFWAVDFNFGVGFLPTLVITTGLLGAAAVLLIFVFLLCAGIKSFTARHRDPMASFLIISSLAGALFLWTALVIYVPSPPLIFLAFILTGLLIALLVIEKAVGEVSFSVKSPRLNFAVSAVMLFLIILSLAGTISFGRRLLGSSILTKALAQRGQGVSVEESEKTLKKSRLFFPSDEAYRALTQIALAKLNELVRGGNFEDEAIREKFKTALGSAIDSAKAAIKVNKFNYQNWKTLGDVYSTIVPLGIEGSYEQALSAYESARKFNPTNPSLPLAVARLEIAHGGKKRARELADEALRMKKNYSEAAFLISQLDVADGNIEDAIKSVESASLLDPNNPLVFFQLGILRYNNKDWKGAIQALERAVGLNRSYSNARYFLGLSYDKIGRSKDAIAQFETIKQFNPDNSEVKLILDNLRSGKNPLTGAETIKDRNELPIGDGE